MPTEKLIDRLARDLRPVRHRSAPADAALLAVLCAVELGLFLWLGAMRPDMPEAMQHPSFWWKLGSLALIATGGGAVAVLSLDPIRSPRRGLRWLAALVVLCLLAGWAINAGAAGLLSLAARLDWRDGVQCVAKMALLSAPAAVGLGMLMRRGAPTDAAGTALAAGIAAAAWGAFVFVFACPFDDPLYLAVWYAIGCAIVTAAIRWLLPRLARW